VTTWLHFVGGFYSPEGFISEARELGVSRRATAHVAKRMAWGDRVILLKCLDRSARRALVLGEFTIRGLTLAEDIAGEVCADLLAQGRAIFNGGGGVVKRACGSYECAGTWSVDATVEEVMEAAIKAAEKKGVDPWVLVSGPLVKIYRPPYVWVDGPAFHRTFSVAADDLSFEGGMALEKPDPGASVMGVRGYQKREHRRRQDVYRQASFL
jgi:hypothetical protein